MYHYLVSPGLELRLLQAEHAETLFALVDTNRSHLREWLPWLDNNRDLSHSQSFIAQCLRQFSETRAFVAGIWSEERLIGVIGHNRIDWDSRISYPGYWLAKDFQGSGIVTRCCQTLIEHAFTELKLNRVVITCARENHRSRAIPERLGFTREGTLREAEWLYDHYVDHVVYGLLQSDWRRNKS